VAVSDGGAEASAQPAAAPAAGAPVLVLNLLTATQEGSEGTAEAAPAGSPATGNSAALAVLDSHAAGPAALHGTAGLDDDFLRVVLARDVPRVSDGALAESADLGAPAAPAAHPAAAYDGYATLEAPAGGLLDRLGLDTRALDAALQNFLHGLDGLGGRLADPRSRLGASAWLLTGAAALALVELDRRRRAAAAEGAGEGTLTWPGPGAPAPEPAS